MTPADLRNNLMARAAPEETLTFLLAGFIPEVVNHLNNIGTRRRMALYGGDRVPQNERNLSDVRNRMSLLIEYKLAWIANDILKESGIDDVFCTNVVANRFPDLEIRDPNGARGIRIEVKCLEAVAEEKGANFDTLKKDINPNTDYVVVFIWEWCANAAAIAWDRAPKILGAFVFHASSLAELRDYNWLNHPPHDLGGGYQGFDLRYAVNCRGGIYNEEEGNYGKLLRIWNRASTYDAELTPLLEETIRQHGDFEDFALWSGFEVLARDVLDKIPGQADIIPLAGGAGFRKQDVGVVFKRRAASQSLQQQVANTNGLSRMVLLTDKYQWIDIDIKGDNLQRLADGRKPKDLLIHLSKS